MTTRVRMGPSDKEMLEAVNEYHALYLKEQPTTLRRCLGCEDWMHSTGSDHRVCNACKGEADFTSSPVGRRLTTPRRGGRPSI